MTNKISSFGEVEQKTQIKPALWELARVFLGNASDLKRMEVKRW